MEFFPPENPILQEFEKIRSRVHDRCVSELGMKHCQSLQVLTSKPLIEQLLRQVQEFTVVLSAGEEFPLNNYFLLEKELQLLALENSVLEEESILRIRAFLQTMERLFAFFKEKKNAYPHLSSLFASQQFEKNSLLLIDKIFDPKGNIYDDASDELLQIRRSLGKVRSEVSKVYQKIIARYRREGKLTRTEESTRNGRRVLSMPVELKRAVHGTIHDYSTSGKTFFIEPGPCLELNNSIASLELEERREIRRLLFELCRSLSGYIDDIVSYQNIAGHLDFSRAKAKFAIDLNCSLPQLNDSAEFELLDARHPMLLLHNKESGKDTIPFDLQLNNETRVLVISGPNAGGKTVCMKAAALIQIMVQAGMLVPVNADSTCGIFKKLFVDIGDAQSLEFELSTYSSRLHYMKIFLEQMNEDSLFLIDEFGSGTDPELGGALAESILEEIGKNKAKGIITTHYLNLKIYADTTSGFINGAMAFDSEKLQPLYKLELGKPGSSYAFVVAQKTGLPESLISRAKKKVNQNHVLLEKLLTELELDKAALTNREESVLKKEKELQKLLTDAEFAKNKNDELNNSMSRKIKHIEMESARKLEKTLNRLHDELIKAEDKSKVIDRFRLTVEKKKKDLGEGSAVERLKKQLENLKGLIPGAKVTLKEGKTHGVIEEVSNGKAKVLFGEFYTTCKLQDLVLVIEKKKKKKNKPNPPHPNQKKK